MNTRSSRLNSVNNTSENDFSYVSRSHHSRGIAKPHKEKSEYQKMIEAQARLGIGIGNSTRSSNNGIRKIEQAFKYAVTGSALPH